MMASRWKRVYFMVMPLALAYRKGGLASERALLQYQSLVGACRSSRWYHQLWYIQSVTSLVREASSDVDPSLVRATL